MQNCVDIFKCELFVLKKNNLCEVSLGQCFDIPCYKISFKEDFFLGAEKRVFKETGLTISVPKDHIASVTTSYPPNECIVAETYYDHGLRDIVLQCLNIEMDQGRLVKGGENIAHIFLYEEKKQ